MSQEKYLKLGELLVRANVITPEQLDKVISIQKQEGGRIGELLIKLGMIKEEDMIATLGKQLNIPYLFLGSGLLKPALDQELEKIIPRDFASRNVVLPLSRNLKSLTCAMFDPLDLILLDNLRKITNCEINPVLATRSDIIRAIGDFYGRFTFLEEAMGGGGAEPEVSITEEGSENVSGREDELTLDKLIARAEEAPVVKLVDLIIRQAIAERASDIHLEPFKDKIILRYRIDGKLYEIPPPAKHLQLPIVSRIKILAKLDIAEKRLPQDGAFTVKTEGRILDLRISTLPTVHGEKVVMRLLKKTGGIPDLPELGLRGTALKNLLPEIKTFHVIKGFLNLILADSYWMSLLTGNFNNTSFVKQPESREDPVVIEYSSPNTNKPLHLGHIRNNLIGYSLAGILKGRTDTHGPASPFR